MDRKFVIALSSLAGSIMLSEAHAIGLGEIRLRSSLNEPLRADIKLVQLNDLSENELIVGLAPKADFDKANVGRDFLLNSLRFRLDLDDPKNPKIVVTTQQPLREPFLNFLVEVQWPSGRLLREYTLLMDLPAFANSKPSSVGEASVSRSRKPVEEVEEVESAPKPRPKPVKAPATEAIAPKEVTPKEKPVAKEPAVEKETVPAQRGVSSDGTSYGPTISSDTTWRIAQTVKGSGSVQQKILAIQRLNPRAFSNGNVNLLKKGQVLKLPSQEEISSIGRSDAITQFKEQDEAWKAGRKLPQQPAAAGAPMDATGRAQAEAPKAAQTEGQLKLATPTAAVSAGQSVQGSGDVKAEVAALQSDLAVGQEELSKAQRENQEILSRTKDLDAQKESAERLLQLQNAELAAMQAKLAEEQQAKAAADAATAQAAADAQAKAAADAATAQAAADAQAKAAADAATAQAAADAQAKAAADAATAQAAADAQAKAAAPADAAVATPAETTPETAAPEAAAEIEQSASPAEPVVVPEAAVEAPAPAAGEQPASSSLLDTLMGNPLIGGVAAAVLVLLAVLGLRKKSKARAEQSVLEDIDSPIEYTRADVQQLAPMQGSSEGEEQLEEGLELGSAFEDALVEIQEPAKAVQPETTDALGEADIYISFGNFDKAEALLKSAISSEPSRVDCRMKLLEVYKESGNLAGFDEAYKALIDLDDDVAIARASELRGAIPGASTTPFAFGVSSAAAAAGITDEEEFDLDFDTDLDVPAEAELAPVELVADLAPAPAGEADSFFDVDFDLDAGADFASNATSIHEAVAAVEDVPAAEEEFSLDFDLDAGADFATNATSIHEAVVSTVVDETPAAELQVYSEQETAMLGAVTADAGEIDEDLDFLSDADESATKLDLARAYIDMGDKDGARDILAEVLAEGRADQKSEAQALLDSIT